MGEMGKEMGEVKLLGGWFSPFVKRVEMALKLKGVEYEYIEQDLINKNNSPLLLQHNPIHKKVPVLLHNNKSIIESAIILEYIDEVWEGPPILPKDPHQRATSRFWANFIEQKCVPATRKAIWSQGEEREKAAEEAAESLKILETELEGKKFFGGEGIGYVDIIGCFVAYWLRMLDQVVGLNLFTKDKLPNVCRWADELCADKFVKQNLPDKERLLARVLAHSQNALPRNNN